PDAEPPNHIAYCFASPVDKCFLAVQITLGPIRSETRNAAINGAGDVAFYAGGLDSGGNGVRGIFTYSTAGVRKVVQTGDPCPTGGTFDMGPSSQNSSHQRQGPGLLSRLR